MDLWRTIGAIALTAFFAAGCASPNAATEGLNDPFEPTNRAIFNANLVLDKAVIRPMAVTYRGVVPVNARDMIRNFLNNLDSVPIFANDVLQGQVDRAGTTLARAVVNTSIGAGGLFDVAASWGLPRHYEDFGQTLAVWGVGEGPYLFLPLIGPANPRDLVGRGVDFLFDPLSYVQWGDEAYIPYTRFGVDALDLRARNIETLDEIQNSSVDFYASVRSLYRQTRNNEINNGAAQVKNLPEF